MANEIERYLEDKLNEAIGEVEAAEQHLPAKVVRLPAKFQQLKQLLNTDAPTAAAAAASNAPKLSRDMLYQLDNLLTQRQMQSKKQSPYSLESLISISKFSSNLDRINTKGPNLPENNGVPPNSEQHRGIQSPDGSTIAPNGEIPQPSSHDATSVGETEAFRWSTRSVDETKVHGLDEKVMSLQRLLVPTNDDDAGFRAIGIVGMRGIGKTTLGQVIFNRQVVKNQFLPRIWVCMSKQPEDYEDNKEEAVKRLLECLGVEEEVIKSAKDHGLKGLLFALRLQLMGKRYLIVLDDVWCKDEKDMDFYSPSSLKDDENCSEKLAYGLPKGCGGAVIVTSRAEELAKKMVGEENLHRLLPISDPESCWKIFKDSAEADDKQLSEGLKSLQGKIVEKCAGLPLAAKMMGQISHEQLPKKPAVPENVPENQQDESHQGLEEQTN